MNFILNHLLNDTAAAEHDETSQLIRNTASVFRSHLSNWKSQPVTIRCSSL